MQLILQSQMTGDVIIIRCQGRIVSGDEVRALQGEVEKLTKIRKRVVLQLGEVSYIDSGGLGALVRLFSVLRFDGGGLKLCQLSPFVLKVLQATNLIGVFQAYASEREAIEAFSAGRGPIEKPSQVSRTRIVCIDDSHDVLAYLKALLKGAGYEVFTTRFPSDAMILVNTTRPRVVICGPGMPAIETGRLNAPNAQVLLLPSDFSTAEASQAGAELLSRVQSVLTAQP
jgi:anti-sigma B factor antagonist